LLRLLPRSVLPDLLRRLLNFYDSEYERERGIDSRPASPADENRHSPNSRSAPFTGNSSRLCTLN